MIRVSAGTAAALKLLDWKTEEKPTTAYLLHTVNTYGKEEKCLCSCGFCPQGGAGGETGNRLSRVTWPAFKREDILLKLARADNAGLERICLQGIRQREGITPLAHKLHLLKNTVSLPISVSAWLKDISEVERLMEEGAERVSIALDAAESHSYYGVKGGSLQDRLHLLFEAVRIYPGRITTHLIRGLGETEEDFLRMAYRCLEKGIKVALFAFTPVRGTALASWSSPGLDSYRRVQAALYLLESGKCLFSSFSFKKGKLVSINMDQEELRKALNEGRAFQTNGCPGCNRPFYNERPGRTPYNYPRPLYKKEVENNFDLLWRSMEYRHNVESSAGTAPKEGEIK